MDPNWILAIILWGVIIGTIVVCLVAEFRKTPEQRAVEAKRIQDTIKRNRKAAERKKQEQRENVPEKIEFVDMLDIGCVSALLMLAILVLICALISDTL